jgi:gamma-glutamyltranspeptidase/glutathione hydrolase
VTADGEGSVVVLLQSLALPFGAGVMPPGTGVVLHGRGARFSLDPASPSALGPRRRPFHSLLPMLVTGEGDATWAAASSGGLAQLETQLQLVTLMTELGVDPQAAVEAPRFRLDPDAPDGAWLEAGLARYAPALRRDGNRITVARGWDRATGFAQALAVSGKGPHRRLLGGADPRAEGVALGA